MKSVCLTLVFLLSELSADVVTWRAYTGWTHGYSLTVDGEAGTITLVKRLAQDKAGEKKSQKIPGSVAFLAYVKNLLKMLPEGEIGPQADDGRIIEVTVASKKKILTKTINEIELYTDSRNRGWIEDPKGESLNGKAMDETTRKEVAEFKKWAEAYILQEVMFDLKEQYFGK